jgi:hypothetical protein
MKKSSSGNYTIYESTDPCELHKYSETLAKELEKKDNEIEKSLKESADNINELEEENILNQENITQIIDLLPKVSNEGESIALENTARAKFTKFRIGGNSSQETRSGKNKIIFDDIKETVNQGITCSIKNGVITLNGTASGVVNFYSNPINISAGKYTLSKNMEGTWSLGTATSSLAILLQQKEKDGSYTTVKGGELTAYSSAKNFTTLDLAEGTYRIRVFIATGNILNNFTWRPQLEEGENFTGFEQGGLMPSVEFPSEIRNVGDNGNLYDKDNPNILDTPIDTSGLGGNVKNTYKTVWIPCKPNTTYTVSKKYDATKNRFALAYSSTEPGYSQQVEGYVSNAYTNVMTITTNSTAKYLIAYVWIAGGSNTYQEMLDSIKIEKGTQATLDNGHGLGSMEIIICNKNILNQDLELFQGNYDNNGNVITNSDRRIDKYIFLAKGNYILWSTINNWINVLIYDKNKKLLSIKNSNANKEIAFTLDEDGYIRFGFNPIIESLDVFQLERNTEKITSEEHKQQIIIFPFKQGQKLMQGDYLADDGIHHKRKQVVLDGSDDEGWNYNGGSLSNNISAFTANISNLISVENTDTKVRVMCNKTIGLSASEATKLQKYNAIAVISDKRIYLCVQRSSFSTSPSTLKTWLQSNPITVEYELAEEVVEPYTVEQKEAYEQIKNAISYKGQTNIFSTNEIKPIFEVEALADIGLLLNNMQAQILAGGE